VLLAPTLGNFPAEKSLGTKLTTRNPFLDNSSAFHIPQRKALSIEANAIQRVFGGKPFQSQARSLGFPQKGLFLPQGNSLCCSRAKGGFPHFLTEFRSLSHFYDIRAPTLPLIGNFYSTQWVFLSPGWTSFVTCEQQRNTVFPGLTQLFATRTQLRPWLNGVTDKTWDFCNHRISHVRMSGSTNSWLSTLCGAAFRTADTHYFIETAARPLSAPVQFVQIRRDAFSFRGEHPCERSLDACSHWPSIIWESFNCAHKTPPWCTWRATRSAKYRPSPKHWARRRFVTFRRPLIPQSRTKAHVPEYL